MSAVLARQADDVVGAAGSPPETLGHASASTAVPALTFDPLLWLLAAIAVVITCVLGIVAHHNLTSARAEAIASALRDNESLARAFEEHIVHTFMNADQLAWSVKQQVERRGLPDDLRSFVARRTVPGTLHLIAAIADERGDVVRHTLPGRSANIADLAHFRAAAREDTGALIIGEPIVGRMSGKPSLHVARRINKADGSFGGIASVALDQSYFARVYGQFNLGSGGVIMLAGTDGLVRARYGPAGGEAVGQRIRSRELGGRIAVERAGSFVEPSAAGGPGQLTAYRVLERYPLVVVVGRMEDDAIEPIRDHQRDYLAGTLLLSLLVWTGFGLLGWQLVRQRRAGWRLQEANARTRAANRVKSDFLTNMTHELRAPLHAIIEDADRLQPTLQDESQKECVRIIRSSAVSLHTMVDSVLDMARIDAGNMAVHLAREPLRALLDELAAVHGALAERKGLSLVLRVAPDVPAQMEMDRGRLKQVLDNLIGNAIKFTEHGRIVLGARVDGGTLVLSVGDTGPGIPAAMHEAIFERFNQGGRGTVGLRGGTGLGLALARDLVRLMGGSIELDSEVGKGSEFRVLLPLRRADGDPADPVARRSR